MPVRSVSLPPRLVEGALRPVYWAIFNERLPITTQRRLLDAVSVIQPVPRGTVRDRVTLGGRPADRFTPKDSTAQPPAAVLYLHGGGFAIGSPRTHRPLTARLARDTGAAVYSLDYRLAPEHPYPAAVDDAEAAFADLVDNHGYAPGSIAIAGDSAGGGIAAAVARRLLDTHGAGPAALVLIAPAVDPAVRGGEVSEDTVLRTGWVDSVTEAYRGTTHPQDPGFAPLYASASGFPSTFVEVGSREMLYPQVSAYVDRLREDGVDVTFTVYDELWHVAQVQAELVRAAAQSVDEITAFLRKHLP